MSRETVQIELPRELLREVIRKRDGVQPLNDRELIQMAPDAVCEVLSGWLGKAPRATT